MGRLFPPLLLPFCLVLLGSLLGSSQDSEAHLEGAALEGGPKRVKRGFTYPGTLWCGAGNIAGSYDELGEHRETDRCCRDHDNCHHVIHPFDYKYGYRNLRWHTISHCDCDNRLKACLGSVNDTSSRVVGQAFFNVIRVPCFRFAYKEQCVEPYLYVWCRNYSTVAVAVVQEQAMYEYGGEVIDGRLIDGRSMTTIPSPRLATPRHQPDVPVVEVTETPVPRKNRPEKPVVITNPPVQPSGFGKKQPNNPDPAIRPRKNRPDPPLKPSRFGKKQPDKRIKVHPGKNKPHKTVAVTDSPVRPSGFGKKQPDERVAVITDAPVRPDESVVITDPPVRPNGFEKNQPVVITDAPVRKNRPDEAIATITDAPVRKNRPDEAIAMITDAPVRKNRPDEAIAMITDAPVRKNRPDEAIAMITDAPVRKNRPDEAIVMITDAPVRKNRPDEAIAMITDAAVRLNRPDKKHRRGKGKKRKGKKGKGMRKKEEKTQQNVPPVPLGDPEKELAAQEAGKMGFGGPFLGEEDPFNAILSDDPGKEVIVPDPVPTISSSVGPFRKKRKERRRPAKKEKSPASS